MWCSSSLKKALLFVAVLIFGCLLASQVSIAGKGQGKGKGPKAPAPVLQTGQTTCYDSLGLVIDCTDTGQDGDLQTGVVRSYTDNLDGTITDNTTGLMWERLTDDQYQSPIHFYGFTYTWDQAFDKIAVLNTEPCFADYYD